MRTYGDRSSRQQCFAILLVSCPGDSKLTQACEEYSEKRVCLECRLVGDGTVMGFVCNVIIGALNTPANERQ